LGRVVLTLEDVDAWARKIKRAVVYILRFCFNVTVIAFDAETAEALMQTAPVEKIVAAASITEIILLPLILS
jgi:hypothetical protein